MKEPISTLTNIAYPLAAYLSVSTYDLDGVLLIVAAVSMAVGSALFHAIGKRNFQALDEVNMYTYLSAIILFNIDPGWIYGLVGIGVIGIGGIIIAKNHRAIPSSRAVPFLVVLAACSSLSWFLALFAIVIFMLALGIRQIGEAHKQNENGVAHDIFHGAWHLLTAAAQFVIVL